MKRPSRSPTLVSIRQKTVAQLPHRYGQFLDRLKERIRKSRLKAAISANRELVLLYWEIGHEILKRQQEEGWGTKVIGRLSRDLSGSFPGMKGFSPRNLMFMRGFAEVYKDRQKVKQLVSQIPWGHIVRLIQAVKDSAERDWYIRKTIERGWSRNILVLQMANGLYVREGKAVSNFRQTLPKPQSDLAQQATKDPYLFDFLALSEDHDEKELEKELLAHIRKFLIELGAGFAFVGQQVPLEIANEDYFIDLLFYHLKLRCYVVIELKAGAFKPEYVGKMNFYLSAVDDLLRHPDDKPTIGLFLCKGKNRVTAEYALRDIHKPIGVSEWKTKIVESLPRELEGKLPSIRDLEKELQE